MEIHAVKLLARTIYADVNSRVFLETLQLSSQQHVGDYAVSALNNPAL